MTTRRGFLGRLGKAFGMGVAAVATVPVIAKEPEVIIKEVIVIKEVEKKWVKPPRPDHTGWPKMTVVKGPRRMRSQFDDNEFAIIFTGPKGDYLYDSIDSSGGMSSRSREESYGWVADMADYYGELTGAHIDDDELERMLLGERRWGRRLAMRCETVEGRKKICAEYKIRCDEDGIPSPRNW